MVKHQIFDVERDIDIDESIFPTYDEIKGDLLQEGCYDDDDNNVNNFPSCEHGWFQSVYEQAKLHYRKFIPSDGIEPKAIIIFMHGISTHGGKGAIIEVDDDDDDNNKNGSSSSNENNENTKKKKQVLLNMPLLVDVLVKQSGYALYAFDLYGHGYSEGTRFYIPNSGDYKINQQDYVNFIHLVASYHDDTIPIILFGESYGCTLTIHVAKQFQEQKEQEEEQKQQSNSSSIDGASASATSASVGPPPSNFDSIILTAPAIIGDLPPYPIYCLLRYGLAPFFPKWIPSFMPNPVNADRIWKDAKVLEKRTNKRYLECRIDGSGIPFRLGTAVGLLVALEDVRTKAIPGLNIPYCILHGTSDYAVPIEGSEYMWNNTSTALDDDQQQREIHRLQDVYHDILGDPSTSYDTVKTIIVRWIQKRIDIFNNKNKNKK